MKKSKLELTWIGKENQPKLEPRILLENPAKSYHTKHRVTDNDLFDNRLKPKDVGATNSHKNTMPYVDLTKGRHSELGCLNIATMLAERERRYFEDFSCARFVVAEMRVLHESDAVNSWVWVVMPDHVHWLFHLGEIESLSSVAKNLKARSAQRMNQYITAVITKKINCVRNIMYLRLMIGNLKAENRGHLSAIFVKEWFRGMVLYEESVHEQRACRCCKTTGPKK